MLFQIAIKITIFSNSNNQELIHHVYHLGYIFYHQSMVKKFVNFIVSHFMFFTLDPIHGNLKNLLFNKAFLYSLCVIIATTFLLTAFVFYGHCYLLQKIFITFALIQHIHQ